MITRALILAAGKGVPIGEAGLPNCLAVVGGRTLLDRTLELLEAVGIQRIGLVVGYAGAAIRRHVATTGRRVTFFENADWDGPNGLSVLAARGFVTERTLLVMSDQIQAPALLRELCALPAAAGPTVLAVDRDLARVFDVADATKVQLDGDRVTAIGKPLTRYDGISAGLFVMAPSLIAALERLPRPSLTEGVQAAASDGLVAARDVAGKLWQDVDTPPMRLHAEWLLRVYGDELARPAVPGGATASTAADTLALIERLLAEKDEPGYILFSPGPVMTSARVKAALVHHDVCHRD
ncbi:MAG TPA: NTP transferase domain-containing protein, partial [Polyangia bacterium]|nr:NTP transferase domain-containing protein [Polyangia bacterium]